MEFKIRIQPGKEKAFQQFIRALQSLGVIEKVEIVFEPGSLTETEDEDEDESASSSEDLASQYRDLVD